MFSELYQYYQLFTGNLKLSKYDEVYTINYPSVYCKQLLTTPYCEITGKCTIECEKTQLSATINFLTKPNIGGELNRFSYIVHYFSIIIS